MATGTITCVPGSALLPDGSASNLAPGLVRVKSTASAPSPYLMKLLFDASVLEQCDWVTVAPYDLHASTPAPIMKVYFSMETATSGNVIVLGRLFAITDGDSQDVNAKAFGTVNTSAATAVPGTAGHMKVLTLTLTNADSVAAGDLLGIYFARDGANGSDTATGDMAVWAVAVTYTTA